MNANDVYAILNKKINKKMNSESIQEAIDKAIANGELVVHPVPIDDTLTKEGEAADAKVTGDALNELTDNINELEQYAKIPINWGEEGDGKYFNTNAKLVSNGLFAISDAIPVYGLQTIKYSFKREQKYIAHVTFLRSNILNESEVIAATKSDEKGDLVIEVPKGALYVRICVQKYTETYQNEVSLYCTKQLDVSGLSKDVSGLSKDVSWLSKEVSGMINKIYKEKATYIPGQYNSSYTYSTSTFSGWITKYDASERTIKIKEIQAKVKARNDALTKARFIVLIGEERITNNTVFDKVVDISVKANEEAYIKCRCDITIQKGLVYYIGVACDKICNNDFSIQNNPTEKTSWYVTNGYLTKKVEEFQNGSAQRLIFIICEYEETTRMEGIESEIELLKNKTYSVIPPRVILPDRYQAVVGDTLQIFYRGIIEYPYPYFWNIEFKCDIGTPFGRYFEITPTDAMIGEHTLIVNIRNSQDDIIAEASTIIEVFAIGSSPTAPVNILCIGDSLTSSGIWCHEADRRLTGLDGAPAGNGLSNIKFIGTKTSYETGYEGYGGWTWGSYLAKPSATNLDMIVYCTHDKDISDQHSLWLDASGNIWSMETISNSNIKFTRYQNHMGEMPTGNGVLTHYSNAEHTDDVVFSSTAYGNGNPFWDAEREEVNFKTYCTRNGFGGIDYVYTLLTWNGNASYRPNVEDNATHVNNAKTLIRKIHEAYPEAKVKICGIQLPSINGGTGYNYGANSGYSNWYGLVRTAMGLNLAYQELANAEEFSNYVEFINISGQFDSENNMPYIAKCVNTRSTNTEHVGNNGVHPMTQGYYQIADAVYRNMIARITG